LSHIRNIEYTGRVSDALRAFKADIFQALAHPTRIAVVEALRGRELGAGALGQRLGLSQANLSQHLAVLRAKQVVVARKAGNQVHYSLRDPVLSRVLDLLKKYFYSHLSDTTALLGELRAERTRRA
jgi:ArsR family transcriptional regulator